MGLGTLVNENIQGIVPIAGRGHVRKRAGNYQPGEFPYLVNCEILEDGSIVNRRPIRSAYGVNKALTVMDNSCGFIGHFRSNPIMSGVNTHDIIVAENYESASSSFLFAPNTIIAGQPAGSWIRLLKYFHYNNNHYWVSIIHNPVFDGTFNPQMYIDIWRAPDTDEYFSGLFAITSSDLIQQEIYASSMDPDEYYPEIVSIFMHKERLWIVTTRTAYFSKATDPMVWTVPDGGFFHFKDYKINDACAYRDSVYIIADNSTHVITYNDDPNTDATVRQMTDNLGGDACSINGDVVYFVRDDGLYAINPSIVERVTELDLIDQDHPKHTWRMKSFGHYLVLLRSVMVDELDNPVNVIDGVHGPDTWATRNKWHWKTVGSCAFDDDPPLTPDQITYGVFFLNTNNGAVHAIDFRDKQSGSSATGVIADAFMCPIETEYNNQYFYFTTIWPDPGTGTWTGFPYHMNLEDSIFSDTKHTDQVHTFNGNVANSSCRTFVEIDSFVPDGSEGLMKKYRNVLIDGQVPDSILVSFGFDDRAWTGYRSLIDYDRSEADDLRYPRPYRVGINQRGRAMSIRLYKDTSVIMNELDSSFMLTRIMTLWSYTGRAPTGREILTP